MINAPHDRGQDWDAYIASQAREHILDKLTSRLGVDVKGLIECERILAPKRYCR